MEVSCVVDPTNFYVQLSDNCIVLAELVEKLNEVYTGKLIFTVFIDYIQVLLKIACSR